MLVTLPFFAFFLFFASFYSKEKSWRSSWLSAAIIWGVMLTAITEILSLFSLITTGWLVATWITVNLLIAFWFFQACGLFQLFRNIQKITRKTINLVKVDIFLDFSLLSIAIILILTALVALLSPPNNYDSMTYHMPRVMNWVQNRSVVHYPTSNLRQIDFPPLSSFAIMHLQILSGSDRFANLVQWFSMAGCLVGVSLIAKQLGANSCGQALASVVCATIPMGILQSVTTQNDYVVSFWLVCAIYNTLLIAKGQITLRICLEFGSSLGLALLTKATSYIYLFPFLIVWVAYLFRYLKLSSWKPILLSLYLAFILNISHWWRNFQAFNSPLGISGDIAKNKVFTVSSIISNIIRNVALHIPVAYQPFNDFFERYITLFHQYFLRFDINDPRTTFPGTTFQLPVFGTNQLISLNEDVSGNPLALVLIIIVFSLYFLMPQLRSKLRSGYVILLLSTILLFSILLAWQPWGTRLHLPFFVLMSPFIGDVISRALNFSRLSYVLVFILTLTSLPYVFFSSYRPLSYSKNFVISPSIFIQPRIEDYFNARIDLRDQYFEAVRNTLEAGCYDIGLSNTSGNSWEYPLWPIANNLASTSGKVAVLKSIVNNDESALNTSEINQGFTPCAIFTLGDRNINKNIGLRSSKKDDTNVYFKILDREQVQVYLQEKFLTGKQVSD